jgi:integrase
VPRNPRNLSNEFARRAKRLSFGGTSFHDLRGIHATALLDARIPVHTVAQRIGDDPAVLLRNLREENAIEKGRRVTVECDRGIGGQLFRVLIRLVQA